MSAMVANVERRRASATVSVVASGPLLRMLGQVGSHAMQRYQQAMRELLPRYGLTPEALRLDGARLPHELIFESMQRSAHALQDEAFMLHSLRGWQLGDHGIGDYMNASCETLGDMLTTATQYLPLLHDGLRLRLQTQGELVYLFCEYEPGVAPHPWFAEGVLGKVVVETRRAAGGRAQVEPLSLHFSHRAPAYEREYGASLGVRVEFDQGHDALVYAQASLATPFSGRDAVLYALLRKQSDAILRSRPAPKSLIDQVRAVAAEELAQNAADQRTVAQRLGMSPATLRRKLEHEHAARYADLVDALKREVAAERLGDGALRIEDIGRQVGFAKNAAFYRAFKRWFSCTPAEYRRALGARR